MCIIRTIITVTGPSGSGKSTVEEYLTKKFAYSPIHSMTTRPKRGEDDIHHKFVTKEELDSFSPDELICRDPYGDYEYAMLLSDFGEKTVVVLEENGLVELFKRLTKDFNVYSIFIDRPKELREVVVGKERVARDENQLRLPKKIYDLIVDNSSSLNDLYVVLDEFVRTIN